MDVQLIDYANINKLIDYYTERMLYKIHFNSADNKRLKKLKEYKLIFPLKTDGFKTQRKEYYSSDVQYKKILSILKYVKKVFKKQYVTECRYELNNHFLEVTGYMVGKGNYRIRVRERTDSNIILVTVMTEIREKAEAR